MTNYIISYDLQRPGQRYAAVEAYIKRMTSYARVLETVWIVESYKTSTTIRDELQQLVDDNDKIIVGVISGTRGCNIDGRAWAVVTGIGAT